MILSFGFLLFSSFNSIRLLEVERLLQDLLQSDRRQLGPSALHLLLGLHGGCHRRQTRAELQEAFWLLGAVARVLLNPLIQVNSHLNYIYFIYTYISTCIVLMQRLYS